MYLIFSVVIITIDNISGCLDINLQNDECKYPFKRKHSDRVSHLLRIFIGDIFGSITHTGVHNPFIIDTHIFWRSLRDHPKKYTVV